MTSGTATRRNRTVERPHPGRRHGGQTKAIATGVDDRRSSNKFYGTVPERQYSLSRLIWRLFGGQR